jgi:hypothetical protein
MQSMSARLDGSLHADGDEQIRKAVDGRALPELRRRQRKRLLVEVTLEAGSKINA